MAKARASCCFENLKIFETWDGLAASRRALEKKAPFCTFLNLVEHHSKESTVHRFEPARPRNRAQHIAANTE
jgi:hypothetical protein